METVVTPVYKVIYNGKNITTDISRYLMDITYTDKVTGESDELEIRLEDKDQQWNNAWYPDKGAVLTAEMGMSDGTKISCGNFMIDEIELSGSKTDGDIVTIKALGTGVVSKHRTKKSHAHEGKTLSEVVNTIAAKDGFKVVGNIENIKIDRLSQYRETNLAFLSRLASEYGYAYSVKGKIIVFTSFYTLEGRKASITLDKTDLISYTFKDKTVDTYNGTHISFHHPDQNRLIQGSYGVASDPSKDSNDQAVLASGETYETRIKAESEQQANAKAKAAYHRHNSLQQTGDITTGLTVLLLAGNNIQLNGIGRNTGVWHVISSRHTISKGGGATSSGEIKRVQLGGNKIAKKVAVRSVSYAIDNQKNKDNIGFNYIRTK